MKEKWNQNTLLANKNRAVNDPEGILRGKRNQSRAYLILQRMVTQGLILRVSKASNRQDRIGIDMFIHLGNNGEDEKLPVQIKSSAKAAQKYKERRKKEVSRKKILVLVVNEHKTDDEIQSRILRHLDMLGAV